MFYRRMQVALAVLVLVLLVSAGFFQAQVKVTSPKEQFGHDVGKDYFLANYTQYKAYIKKLAQESNRMTVTPMGKSEEGRTMYLAIITSPENHKNLARYKDISKRLALAESL